MKFEGTYTYLMDTPSGKRETKVVIRKGSVPTRASYSPPTAAASCWKMSAYTEIPSLLKRRSDRPVSIWRSSWAISPPALF